MELMSGLDPRMEETLPPPSSPSIGREHLTTAAHEMLKRENKFIDQLALTWAIKALSYVQDIPTPDVAEALYVNAEAMRRAAEILDERARLISNGGKNGKG